MTNIVGYMPVGQEKSDSWPVELTDHRGLINPMMYLL